jgi:hypothetical protein
MRRLLSSKYRSSASSQVGYGSGALAILDPAHRAVVRTIALGAHPEGFQVDGEGRKAFVNIPEAHKIVVIDLSPPPRQELTTSGVAPERRSIASEPVSSANRA